MTKRQGGLHQHRSPRLLWNSILLAGFILLINIGMMQLITNEYQKVVLIDGTYPLWDLWAALGLGYAAWRSRAESRRLALAWGSLAVAACSSGIGNGLWALFELGQGSVPFPSVADIFYLAMYPLVLLGVLLIPTKYSHPMEWLTVIIDMVIVIITATLIFWHNVLGSAVIAMTEVSTLGQIVALAYPIGDMVLLWAILVILYRGVNRQHIGPLLLLVGATGITIVADSIYSTQVMLETYTSAGLLDLSWIVTSLLYGIAGIWHATVVHPATSTGSSRLAHWLKRGLSYLPYLCAIGTYLLLEIHHGQGEQLGPTWQTWSMGGILLLILLRLLVNRWENYQQAQRLHQTNLALHAEIDERKQQEKQIQHYVHTLEALHQVHLSVAAELDLEKLTQLVTDVATDLSEAEFGAFFYHQPHLETDIHMCYSLSGIDRKAFQHFPIPSSTHLFGPLLHGVKSIRLADITQEPHDSYSASGTHMPPGHLPVRSYLAVPVLGAHGEPVGSLILGHSRPGIFTQQAEDLVVGIAAQAGVAVQKARLYTQVKEREERFRQLIEEAADGILVGDQAGICQEVNTALCQLLGYRREELIGRRLRDLMVPEDAPHLAALQEKVSRKEVDVAEWTFLRRDGTRLLLESSIKALSDETWQAIVRDITERKRIEERERQQDRLAVVGQLAAGIAHDFNNSLSIILLQAQLILHAAALSSKEQQRLQTIYEQTRHAAQLTTQIVDFSRQSVLEEQEIDLCSFLTDIVALLKRTLSDQVQISFNSEEQTAPAKIDATRLQQVMINLAVNARDAMPQGGTLQIQLSMPHATPQQARPFPALATGDWFCITVTDSGTGIKPEDLPHIFEPFFSTKARGEGTGLGLAQVHGIIQQHGGFIDVASQPGKGTSFFLYLPALHTSQLHASPTPRTAVHTGQQETILVVEDDDTTCAVVADMLCSLNYQVLTAANGKEALKIYAQHQDHINLVLSDLMMPHMNGRELLQQLREKDGAIKLVMMSGYPQSAGENGLEEQPAATWLSKPFTLEQVAMTIHETLGHCVRDERRDLVSGP